MAKVIRIRQAKQARNSETYDDQQPNGSVMETAPIQLEQDLNNLRSQLRRIIDASGNWFDDPAIDLATLLAQGLRKHRQELSGTIDGVNVDFTAPEAFRHTGGDKDEQVYRNGILQAEGPGCDYEAIESGGPSTGFDTIRWAIAPKTGEDLRIDYTPE